MVPADSALERRFPGPARRPLCRTCLPHVDPPGRDMLRKPARQVPRPRAVHPPCVDAGLINAMCTGRPGTRGDDFRRAVQVVQCTFHLAPGGLASRRGGSRPSIPAQLRPERKVGQRTGDRRARVSKRRTDRVEVGRPGVDLKRPTAQRAEPIPQRSDNHLSPPTPLACAEIAKCKVVGLESIIRGNETVLCAQDQPGKPARLCICPARAPKHGAVEILRSRWNGQLALDAPDQDCRRCGARR